MYLFKKVTNKTTRFRLFFIKNTESENW